MRRMYKRVGDGRDEEEREIGMKRKYEGKR